MRYSAVVFDLYGTLVDNAPPELMSRMYREPAALLGGDTEKLATVWQEMRIERGTGKFGSVEGDIREACRLVGVTIDEKKLPEVIRVRMSIFMNCLVPRSDTLDTLKAIKAAGLKLGLISDCGLETPMGWPETPFAPLFDHCVFSARAGVVKPHPKLYAEVCDKLGVEPSQCLYVGDGGSREMTGAREAGMHPVLINVGYESHLDVHRPDAVEWTGPVISRLSEVLGLLGQQD